ncbi:MAG: TRAP transporter small permease [Myxococcota bacterium]|nr:TRAP transporter small permease [Myxococcota bacterium]
MNSSENTLRTSDGPDETPIRRLAHLVDHCIYRIETALVTIAALVMTATVTLAIVHRSFANSDSLLAKKILAVFGWFGLETTPARLEFVSRWITPMILAALVFFIGRSIYGATTRLRGDEPSKRSLTVSGFVSIALMYGLLQLIMALSSRWICTGLVVLGCALWFKSSLRTRRVFDSILSLVLMGLGCWACTTLRPGYNWAQELSLILLAWMAFLGGSMATRAGRHIQVDALSKVVPTRFRPWTRAIGLSLATAFCAYLTYLAYIHVFGSTGDFYGGEIRPATRLPAWVIILSAVVSFGLMTLRFGAMTVDAFVNRRLPSEELVH